MEIDDSTKRTRDLQVEVQKQCKQKRLNYE